MPSEYWKVLRGNKTIFRFSVYWVIKSQLPRLSLHGIGIKLYTYEFMASAWSQTMSINYINYIHIYYYSIDSPRGNIWSQRQSGNSWGQILDSSTSIGGKWVRAIYEQQNFIPYALTGHFEKTLALTHNSPGLIAFCEATRNHQETLNYTEHIGKLLIDESDSSAEC